MSDNSKVELIEALANQKVQILRLENEITQSIQKFMDLSNKILNDERLMSILDIGAITTGSGKLVTYDENFGLQITDYTPSYMIGDLSNDE